jgi:hypothetical protein
VTQKVEHLMLRKPSSRPSWKGYIIPANHLWRVLSELLEALNEEMSKDYAGNDGLRQKVGAKKWLGERVQTITGGQKSSALVIRRIYDIENGLSKAVDATLADAMMLAFDKLIDRDTDLPTFPGSRSGAQEMVRLRRPNASKEEVERLAERLLDYRDRILYPDGWETNPISHKRRIARHKAQGLGRRAA